MLLITILKVAEMDQRRNGLNCRLDATCYSSRFALSKVRRGPARHDNVDFQPINNQYSHIKPLSVAVADKGYDSEENHVLVREHLNAYSIIPPRHQNVPIWKTHGRYRKQMKTGLSKDTIQPAQQR